MKIPLHSWLIGFACLISTGQTRSDQLVPANVNSFIVSDFEKQAHETWPQGWPQIPAASWESEPGNQFIRIQSSEPGKTNMLYREITVPEGINELQLTLLSRVSNLKRGTNSWFDARIMMEWMDANRNKVPVKAPVLTWSRNTDGWEKRSVTFPVPDGARILKFMPCLFQVETGTFDLDNVVIREAPDAEEIAESKPDYDKLPPLYTEDFSTHSWQETSGTQLKSDHETHYLQLHDADNTQVVKIRSAPIALPNNAQAIELSWRQRITRTLPGPRPYFSANLRFIPLNSKGEDFRRSSSPEAIDTLVPTSGWVEMTDQFLVSPKAKSFEIEAALYTANAASFDIDHLQVRLIDPEALLAEADAKKARIQASLEIPNEEPLIENWPSMLTVVGNRLHDEEGNEVWLQGLNAGGLETLSADRQVLRSVLEAIENWNANCIRLPIRETYWYGQGEFQDDGGEFYRNQIDKAVTLAANRGAYVVIDLHRFRAPKQEHADFWKDCAEKYKDHPAVLFDVFNEPHGISWEVWRNGGFVGEQGKHDESAFLTDAEKKANNGFESVGMQGLVDAVRSTGAKNIIIAGGVWWCNDLSGVVNGYALDDETGNGIMYSWHTYHWHDGWEKKVMAAAEKYPIFLGEVGADVIDFTFVPRNEVQENPYTWVPDMLGFIQKYKINWTGWCFHPAASPILITDWEYTPTPFWGNFAKEALAGQSFELQKMR
ncbi:glycoside hydrolase family 5 protein [Kiritimatiellota bacterium B12222]|nr:glycoside hydrolase family 5 protein [Kiritimatiellota bacterium B12222]